MKKVLIVMAAVLVSAVCLVCVAAADEPVFVNPNVSLSAADNASLSNYLVGVDDGVTAKITGVLDGAEVTAFGYNSSWKQFTVNFAADYTGDTQVTIYNNTDYIITLTLLNEADPVVIPNKGTATISFYNSHDTSAQSQEIRNVQLEEKPYTVWEAGGLLSIFGTILSYVTGSALLPLFLVGVAGAIVFFAVKLIRRVMWSN